MRMIAFRAEQNETPLLHLDATRLSDRLLSLGLFRAERAASETESRNTEIKSQQLYWLTGPI
jgi:hypothetical protein